jgi:hypothetical protein
VLAQGVDDPNAGEAGEVPYAGELEKRAVPQYRLLQPLVASANIRDER